MAIQQHPHERALIETSEEKDVFGIHGTPSMPVDFIAWYACLNLAQMKLLLDVLMSLKR